MLFLAIVFSVFSWDRNFSNKSFDYANALQKSRHLASEHRLSEALDIAQRLAKKFPDQPYYLQHLANLYEQTGDTVNQAEVIKHLIESSPMIVAQETCPFKIPKGNLLLLQKCADRLPDDPDTLVLLAMTQIKNDHDLEAKRHLEHAKEISPRYADIYLGLAQIADKAGDHDTAIAHYSQAQSLRPDDPEIQKIIQNLSIQKRDAP